jgi:hypothetical protein
LSKPSELIPNSFQMPNFLVDKLLCHLSGPQAKVLMVLCRKTFGWNKREDIISFGQFRDIAGVSRSSAVDALRVLVDSGLVIKTTRGTLEMSSWSLNLNADTKSVLARLKDRESIDRPSAYTANQPIPPVGIDRPEVHNYTAQRSIPIPPVGPTETQETHKPNVEREGKWDSSVEEAWRYYCQTMERGPQYEFSPQRRQMGIEGLRQAR